MCNHGAKMRRWVCLILMLALLALPSGSEASGQNPAWIDFEAAQLVGNTPDPLPPVALLNSPTASPEPSFEASIPALNSGFLSRRPANRYAMALAQAPPSLMMIKSL